MRPIGSFAGLPVNSVKAPHNISNLTNSTCTRYRQHTFSVKRCIVTVSWYRNDVVERKRILLEASCRTFCPINSELRLVTSPLRLALCTGWEISLERKFMSYGHLMHIICISIIIPNLSLHRQSCTSLAQWLWFRSFVRLKYVNMATTLNSQYFATLNSQYFAFSWQCPRKKDVRCRSLISSIFT